MPMRNFIIMVAMMMCIFATAANAQIDTTINVGYMFQGGNIQSISVRDKYVIVDKGSEQITFEISSTAEIDTYYYPITSITIRNGEVIFATGSTPKWVTIALISIIVLIVIVLLVIVGKQLMD